MGAPCLKSGTDPMEADFTSNSLEGSLSGPQKAACCLSDHLLNIFNDYSQMMSMYAASSLDVIQ